MKDDPIQQLGGIRPAARALGVPVGTVAGWKKNGIPSWRWPQIEAALRTSDDFHEQGAAGGAA